jgi:hypothetical protein
MPMQPRPCADTSKPCEPSFILLTLPASISSFLQTTAATTTTTSSLALPPANKKGSCERCTREWLVKRGITRSSRRRRRLPYIVIKEKLYNHTSDVRTYVSQKIIVRYFIFFNHNVIIITEKPHQKENTSRKLNTENKALIHKL